jgi:hypothetical protein
LQFSPIKPCFTIFCKVGHWESKFSFFYIQNSDRFYETENTHLKPEVDLKRF